jgi:hypothetical protein
MRQTRMSGAMRGSQETKTVSKGTRLRACSLLYKPDKREDAGDRRQRIEKEPTWPLGSCHSSGHPQTSNNFDIQYRLILVGPMFQPKDEAR